MANPPVGHFPCPACELDAEVRNTAKGKPYIVCDDCGFQGFARGEGAITKLRAKMRPIAAAIAAAFPNPPTEDIEAMATPKKKPAKKPAAPPKKQEPAPAAPPAAGDDFETFTGGKPAKGEGEGFGKWLNL